MSLSYASGLYKMSLYDFTQLYYKTVSLVVQITENMGFEHWERE